MAIERIDEELCSGCGACVEACPMDVIRMGDVGDLAVIRYQVDCMMCELCVLDCPEDAITVTPFAVAPPVRSWG